MLLVWPSPILGDMSEASIGGREGGSEQGEVRGGEGGSSQGRVLAPCMLAFVLLKVLLVGLGPMLAVSHSRRLRFSFSGTCPWHMAGWSGVDESPRFASR